MFGLLGIATASLVDVLRVGFPCSINVLIQIPQYLLIGLAESFGIVSRKLRNSILFELDLMLLLQIWSLPTPNPRTQ